MAETPEELIELAARFGFDISHPYCDRADLVRAVRELDALAAGGTLTDTHRLALRENVRRVLLRTAAAPRPVPSLAAQSRLPRWRHLRTASPEGADVLAGVLLWGGIEVPEWLLSPTL